MYTQKECGHICEKKCWEKCETKCQIQVNKTLICGHQIQDNCSKKDLPLCQLKSLRKLSCGHSYMLNCNLDLNLLSCQETVQKALKCGHKITTICSVDVNTLNHKCMEMCNKFKCGHQCTKYCYEKCKPCSVIISQQLPCKHLANIECYQRNNYPKCNLPCTKPRNCGHQEKCTNTCSQSCSPCNYLIDKLLNCKHTKKVACSNYERIICDQLCSKYKSITLKCGHLSECRNLCGQPCSECIVPVEVTLQCGHTQISPCHTSKQAKICRTIITETLRCGHQLNFECCDSLTVEKLCQNTSYRCQLIGCNIF